MKLRIVTATRGESPFLSEALASIARACPGSESVIVCPAKRAPSIEAELRIPVIADTGGGLYSALNIGLLAPGKWDAFTWLNDDDVLLAPGFGRLLEALERQAAVGVVYGRVRLVGTKGEDLGEIPTARRGDDLAPLLARGIVPFAQPGTILRRSVIEQLGAFDEQYHVAGDLDLFARALESGVRFGYVDCRVAAFRLRAGQLSKRRHEVEAETARALDTLALYPRSLSALLRFRIGNAGVYLERFRRHGFVSMRDLYDRSE